MTKNWTCLDDIHEKEFFEQKKIWLQTEALQAERNEDEKEKHEGELNE